MAARADSACKNDESPLGKRARLPLVSANGDGELRWGQNICDQGCEVYKAQEMVECLLQSLIEIRMMQPQSDDNLAFLIGWATNQLERRGRLPHCVNNFANILAVFDKLWFDPGALWTPEGDDHTDWNKPFDYKHNRFNYPSATSIFVSRKCSARPDLSLCCTCAEAAEVKESGLHVWLYLHQDENGESFRWIPQQEVKTWMQTDEFFLADHDIYQTFARRMSYGPPMMTCMRGHRTSPNALVLYNKMQNWLQVAEGFDDGLYTWLWEMWKHWEPNMICQEFFRCKQCGLFLLNKRFHSGRDGLKPKMDLLLHHKVLPMPGLQGAQVF